MDGSKRHKVGKEAEAISGTSDSTECNSCSESASEMSSSDGVAYEVVDLSLSNRLDVSIIVDQSRILPSSEELLSVFVNSKVLVSGDVVLSFCGFLQLSRILSMAQKKLKKAFNSLIAAGALDGINRDDIYIFYTERAVNIPLEMILDQYRSLSFANLRHIIFISRIKACMGMEMKDLVEDFKEYSPLDLNHRPVRGEEILLLSSYMAKKQVVVNSNTFRLFLLDSQMFASFISLFEKELSEIT
ncbi:hypothetical protein [Encephalitozoon cuniculi GB-M1]|uniref:Uncharacterized protein n=2 Tax=Encephalitozoon cuniculi TaxID=6035 RepID=Q8SVR9_ENCCU|nr:uncharacterized protein ECU04_1330 [Encephalitozoon cuniculi GB-M1]UYI27515.1 hypothetical protein J0A71_06g13860 [Encephalitozoon cuniculi]CAD25321.1 hypothetical protein [Encephalitozoon cuniculi GB-M1]